ncbi:MAG: indole-3-glycerol phosphate synthase TrpC [Candidatus Desulforudis sp.]|nr:indole-3-glycerol phosphate synthase TrpC [Desulforudis sp.]
MLNKIVASKLEEVQTNRRIRSLEAVKRAAEAGPETRSLKRALVEKPGVSLIAELKRQSPSAGLIRSDFDPVLIAGVYERAGAAAISVLTDHQYFGGRPEYLNQVRRAVGLPLLRKDFIVSDYQVYESRALGADAILLIAAVLDDSRLREYQELADALGMECLVEVHDLPELERTVASGATLIGINNRNLRIFKTDLATSRELAAQLPPEALKVSESGIRNRGDVLELESYGFDAVLVGETLMRAPDIAAQVRELLGQA